MAQFARGGVVDKADLQDFDFWRTSFGTNPMREAELVEGAVADE